MTRKLALFAALAGLAAPTIAFAHPHIFVEARLEVVAGNDGNVQELRNVWRFDEVFSSTVLLDFDKNSNLKLDPEELKAVGKTVKESLADFDYYTNISQNGAPVEIAPPDVINVDFKDGQLLMIFAVKPAKPMKLKGDMTFGVWDPTLYTSIDFATDKDIIVDGDGFKACQHKVVRPNADEVIAQNQKTLTQAFFNDPMGTTMSKLFATRIDVTC
jgi:ABC-type uncharacterized transport system substrate-binding protein